MKNPLPLLVLMLCTSAALAEPPGSASNEEQKAASELVDKQLLTPLKKAESRRKRFSRAAPVPVQRRVRVLDSEAQADVRGKQFVRFAIDVRRAWNEQGPWEKDSVVGCAYPNEREVFVQHGTAYVAARSMLGADEKERSDVCRAAPQGAVVEARGSAPEQDPVDDEQARGTRSQEAEKVSGTTLHAVQSSAARTSALSPSMRACPRSRAGTC